MDRRITLEIKNIRKESKSVKTFTFSYNLNAKPGQFIMLTDFECGEKPFSISDCTDNEFSITVKKIGEFTTRLFQLKKGDVLSFRGPYGSSFSLSDKVLLIGGGYAVPPLLFLSKMLKKYNADITIINGAKTKEDILFIENFKRITDKVFFTTDDGSLGNKGTVMSIVSPLLQNEKFDMIYASGPEPMLKKIVDMCDTIPCEVLIERYMKCAIGICGQCVIDSLGIIICKEGPVLDKEVVKRLSEFGVYKRNASGKRVYF
ncbi:MAG: dihydroorotate dehydrogenase electron transfer subunit [Candidatus Cloacimonadota bacterium]|nr:MAG: dihydroorotate dehydrogenase electron transfer subunit [Candidatus Cloacimonadota bacterium]